MRNPKKVRIKSIFHEASSDGVYTEDNPLEPVVLVCYSPNMKINMAGLSQKTIQELEHVEINGVKFWNPLNADRLKPT